MRNAHRPSRGQALPEFALVLPIFLLMLFAILDFGRAIYTYNTLANAARDGARVAIVNQSTTGTNTCDTTSPTVWATGCAVVSAVNLDVSTSDVSVTYRDPTDTAACDPLSMGCLAVVTVTARYEPITPVIGQLIGPITLTSTVKIPVERVCTGGC